VGRGGRKEGMYFVGEVAIREDIDSLTNVIGEARMVRDMLGGEPSDLK